MFTISSHYSSASLAVIAALSMGFIYTWGQFDTFYRGLGQRRLADIPTMYKFLDFTRLTIVLCPQAHFALDASVLDALCFVLTTFPSSLWLCNAFFALCRLSFQQAFPLARFDLLDIIQVFSAVIAEISTLQKYSTGNSRECWKKILITNSTKKGLKPPANWYIIFA